MRVLESSGAMGLSSKISRTKVCIRDVQESSGAMTGNSQSMGTCNGSWDVGRHYWLCVYHYYLAKEE